MDQRRYQWRTEWHVGLIPDSKLVNFLSFCISYLLWSLWVLLGGAILPADTILAFASDTAVKALIWLGPGMIILLRKNDQWLVMPQDAFTLPFPWLPTVAGLCLTAVFLHTAHILTVGIGTWGVFQFSWIWVSLAAAVIEELAFRGVLFNRQAAAIGVKWAVPVNGLFFALYHFPEFLAGQNLFAIFGFRFWLLFVIGCIFSFAFAKWKHLGMVMGIHFVWNLLCHWFALV